MKKLLWLCVIIIIGLTIISCAGTEKAAGTGKANSTSFNVTSNERGKTDDGYDYEFWRSNTNVTGKMTIKDDGAFSCEWSSGGNILFRIGKRYNSAQPHSAFGKFAFKYNAVYNPGNSGVSYLSVYGWTRNPLVEYYIVENYAGSYHPGTAGVKKGTFTIDDEGTYDVYTREMIQQPAIVGSGNYNFIQYISVRTVKRTSGTISVSKHFEEWEKLGLNMSGGFYEVMMKVEGYNNSGTADIIENTLIIN